MAAGVEKVCGLTTAQLRFSTRTAPANWSSARSVADAPTVNTFLAVAGVLTVLNRKSPFSSSAPALPAATTTSTFGCSYTNLSTDADP
jgi:hypothetical protein